MRAMTPSPSARALLRQERSRRTRAALVEAARALLLSRGFEATTVADICAAAGVSKGTFFFYFPRKEDVLLELVATGGERLQAWVEAGLASDMPTESLLRALVGTFAERMSRVPQPLLQRILQELLGSAEQWQAIRQDRFDLTAGLAAVFARAQARDEVGAEHDPADVADLLMIVMLQGVIRWLAGRIPDLPLDDALWRRVGLILRGVHPDTPTASNQAAT